MRRVSLVGSSCSGKSTVARAIAERLGLSHLELDSLRHQANWEPLADEEFRRQVSEFSTGESWVIDGNYNSVGITSIVWKRADAVVWLDLPKRVVMWQAATRSIRRVITRKELWNGNRERWSNLLSPDPLENAFLWAWTRFERVRETYESANSSGEWSHLQVFRLHSRAEVDRFLTALPSG